MANVFPEVLQTSNLLLRQPRRRDLKEWLAVREQNRKSLRSFEPSWPKRLDYKAWRRSRMANAKASRGVYYLIFLNQESLTLVGGVNLDDIKLGSCESARLGYWLSKPYWGRGIMRQSLHRVLLYAFFELGLERVEAATLLDNARSIALLDSLAFRKEGVCRKLYRVNGERRDHLLFALLRDEFYAEQESQESQESKESQKPSNTSLSARLA